MSTSIRTIEPHEITAFRNAVIRGFGGDPDEHGDRGDERIARTVDLARTYAAFDGGAVVGTSSTFALDLAVPGGAARMGGFTMATVRPTHRRRGILRAMIEAHLDDARARREPLSGLWSSEAPIYGRFGYGLAAEGEQLAYATVVIPEAEDDRVELVDEERARQLLPVVYERTARARPGTFARSEAWWELRVFDDSPARRQGASARRHAVAFREGAPVGYAVYRQRPRWEGAVADGTIEIIEMFAEDRGAERTLWRFVSSIDLFRQVKWWNAPVDSALPWLAADRRRITRTRTDTLWLRICDVKAALEGRAYAADGSIHFAVEDPGAPDVAGSYALRVEGGRATCAPATSEPDLRLGVGPLSSLYLGGVAPSALARAGLIDGEPDALAHADRLFSWPVAPWCPEIF
jgi:predicted acetyltransferase